MRGSFSLVEAEEAQVKMALSSEGSPGTQSRPWACTKQAMVLYKARGDIKKPRVVLSWTLGKKIMELGIR